VKLAVAQLIKREVGSSCGIAEVQIIECEVGFSTSKIIQRKMAVTVAHQ
jgi:hypothetical protein